MNFPELKNDRLIRAARGEKVDRVPVWVMGQAGRYLQEFRELNKKHNFFTICQTPELAAEATLQPIRRFELDAAIIFSDILVIPKALGMTVEMTNVGPVLPKSLRIPYYIDSLVTPVDIHSKLGYVLEAITLTRNKLEGKVPLIGFSGAPFTLMGYMIEGAHSTTLSRTKAWLYQYPHHSHRLLLTLTRVIVDYLVEQAAAGAQMLQVFESSSHHLSPEYFKNFSLPYIFDIGQKVKSALKLRNIGDIPLSIYTRGAHYALNVLSDSSYDVVGLDWTVDPVAARKQVGPNTTLQGNFDPCALFSHPDYVAAMAHTMVGKFGKQNYIANLGHAIYPDTSANSIRDFIEGIHQY